jgi:hypothetical protein
MALAFVPLHRCLHRATVSVLRLGDVSSSVRVTYSDFFQRSHHYRGLAGGDDGERLRIQFHELVLKRWVLAGWW